MGRRDRRDRPGRLELVRRSRRGSALLKPAPRVAIVGAGIGGLAAAHRLQELSREHGHPVELLILEASGRAGGALGTERFEGALLERGPDTLVTAKPAGIALVKRLGLESRLLYPPAGGTTIVHGGRLVAAPEGFAILAPARVAPLISSPLLSPSGKLRVCAEPLIRPEKAAGKDESVASFVRRRFGRELLERLAEPIAGAIYMADLERLSLGATFPRFQAMEREHGSVTRAFRRASSSRPPAPPVAALEGGFGQIVDALVDRLPAGAVSLGIGARRIARSAGGLVVDLGDGSSLAVSGALIATPAPVAASVLCELAPELAGDLAAIPFASCATVTVAWPGEAIARPARTFGFFVPRSEGLALVAGTHLDVKHADRVPEGLFLVRAFLGGAARPDISGQSDAELTESASQELARLFGATGPPSWSLVVRHPGAMPQPAVGHPELVERIRGHLALEPGLELAGGPLGAYGLPDSIAAAEGAAERLWDRLAAQAAW